MPAQGLNVHLESPLPAALPVGSATAIFCAGSAHHPDDEVRALAIVVDGVSHPAAALGMPRPDLPDAYRSGFWGTVPIAAHAGPGAVELEADVELARGGRVRAPLGRIEVVEAPVAPRRDAPPGAIAVCLATFEPDPALFRVQIESLRAQTDERWICLLSDDCSDPAHFERIAETIGSDPRFVVSRSARRLGFYRNFERALRMVPAGFELVALCDQDDRWYPEKLATLRRALGGARLVYSDQRLVDAGGKVLRETMWKGRRNNHTSLASLLVANSITGAATLFRRNVMELALPFPDTPGLQFHDHWLGLVALAAGDIAYVDEPLYDYVQHRGAVFGDVDEHAEPARRAGSRGWRAAYFCGYLAREVQARVLLARGGARLAGPKRRALERFVAAGRSPAAFAWLALRPLRMLVGRNETLGSETELAQGIAWKWLIGLRARRSRTTLDASFPDPLDFEQKRLRRWRARS
jgi:glycosyltransferase involved in cell wall biosynthesis